MNTHYKYLIIVLIALWHGAKTTNKQDTILLSNEAEVTRMLTYTIPNNMHLNGNLTLDGTLNGLSLLSAYGKLSLATQGITFPNADDWLPVPFNSADISSNVTVSTDSPATMTVQQAGVYQINFNLYFSLSSPDEGAFTATTYTVGLRVNSVTTPVAAVYMSDPGACSLTYSNIMQFDVNDYVQFYIEASHGADPYFANHVTLENGSASIVQILS